MDKEFVPKIGEVAESRNFGHRIFAILGVETDTDDLSQVMQGVNSASSGSWLFEREDFNAWAFAPAEQTSSQPLLLIGPPGRGKSALSGSAVRYLQAHGRRVHYHFFNRTDQSKRTASYCLRSIASQMAHSNATFRDALFHLHDRTGATFHNDNQGFQLVWDRLFEGVLFQMQSAEPIFWVFDGLDESDVPTTLLSRIAAMKPQTPIRVLLSTRPVKGIPVQATTLFLQPSDTTADMLSFVTAAVQTVLPNDESIQSFVRGQILSKAEGSFLWARLALDIIQDNWHTKGDIVTALTEVPKGMSAMYSHMMSTVEEQNPRNRQLAREILAFVVCSWRPLYLDELADALRPQFGAFINLALTITQVCGHFVTIDQPGSGRQKASLVHVTAKDFLAKSRGDSNAWINPKQAHEKIARVCLSYLCDDTWRRRFSDIAVSSQTPSAEGADTKVNRLDAASRDHPLLCYATYHWAYHLSKSPIDSPDLMETLESFMLNHCLTWIEGIALSDDMGQLIRSARDLKAYVKRSTRTRHIDYQTLRMSASGSRNSLEWINLWAVDFIRIAGKFSANLVLSPSSVYRNVPPMCPKMSMLGKTFGSPRPGSLSVSGLPSEAWDDCLASVVMGNDEFVNQVLANETHFFTLSSSCGDITVWSAETCERTRTLQHGEYVSRMAINGTLLASTGFTAFHIWETSSGKLLQRIPKDTDSLVRDIALGPGRTELVVAFDDCAVQCIDVQSGRTMLHEEPDLLTVGADYQGCPWHVAISPDVTKVAMGWRGRPPLIWDLRGDRGSSLLKCPTKGFDDPCMYPKRLQWHPESGSLLILCMNTCLVEWLHDEIVEHSHVKIRDMAISNNGDLLLTADHTGTLSVRTFPKLNLLYSLINSGDPTTDMVFSPDSQRFYDVRNTSCHVWQPDVLVRADDQDFEDASSASGSYALTEPVVSNSSSVHAAVTSLTTGPTDRHFACGREDGSVIIHDGVDGKRVRKVFMHPSSMAVVKLSWSASGRYMVSCDESAFLVVKRLQLKDDGKWAVFPVLDRRLEEPVRQILFCPEEKLLLVSSPRKDRVWDLKGKLDVYTAARDDGQDRDRHWVQDPTVTKRLLLLSNEEIRAYEWATGDRSEHGEGRLLRESVQLEPASNTEAPRASPQQRAPSPLRLSRIVTWSSAVGDGCYQLLVRGLPASDGSMELQLAYLGAGAAQGNVERGEKWRMLPLRFHVQAKLPLGTIGNHLVFLGFDGWICSYDVTWRLSHEGLTHATRTEPAVRRHFYLPKDWLNTTTSRMAVVNGEGTLFCPKLGDVAIVRNGLRF